MSCIPICTPLAQKRTSDSLAAPVVAGQGVGTFQGSAK